MEKNARPYIVEFLGTFAVVFLSAGVVCVNHLAATSWAPPGQQGVIVQAAPGLAGIALVAGLSYAVALAITLPHSTGFLNPAVTLLLYVLRRLDGSRAAGLIGVQLLAALVAGMLLRLFFPEDVLVPTRLGTPHLNPAVLNLQETGRLWTMLKGIGLEFVFSALLTLALFELVLDPRRARPSGWGHWLGPLWVGLCVVVLTLVGHGLTGAALNPARWFGPVVWELTVPSLSLRGPFDDHTVYWLGPIAGTLVMGLVFSAWIRPMEETRPS